jgi:hypothetical protein
MLQKKSELQPLTPGLRSLFYKPIFYRAWAFDLFLPALILISGLGLLLRFYLVVGDPKTAMLIFFIVLVLAMNRLAWLLTGRGRVLPNRLRSALALLLTESRLELLPFCLHARIPWEACAREIDFVMADMGYRGYLNYEKMELIITEHPVVNKRCPVCAAILSGDTVVERACGICGAVYYI